MFTMMNEARAMVGMQGLAQAAGAYQVAASLRPRAAAGPRRPGAAEPRRPGRPDHRPPRRAPGAARPEGLRRGRPRLRALGRDADRRPRPRRRRGGARPRLAADPGGEGLPHRQGLRVHGAGAADLRRPRLHRGDRPVAVRPRRPHRDDLRGRQRHPGARPRRPQARPGRRQADHGLLRPRSRPSSRRTRPTRA